MDSSEAWQHETECKHVARLMWRGMEGEFLEKVEKARGKEVADQLRFEAMEIVRMHRKGV